MKHKFLEYKGEKYYPTLGVPEYYKDKKGQNNQDQWFWREGTKKEDNHFLFENALDNVKAIKTNSP